MLSKTITNYALFESLSKIIETKRNRFSFIQELNQIKDTYDYLYLSTIVAKHVKKNNSEYEDIFSLNSEYEDASILSFV